MSPTSGTPPPSAPRRLRTGVWGAVLAALVLGTALLWFRRATPPVAARESMPEVERSALVLEEGRLRFSRRAFTGYMLEHYPEGSLKSRSAISNGVLHGVSEGWYTNRALQVTEHFVNGVSHGERLQWNERGRQVSAAQIVEGRIEGVFRRWHDNGTLAEEVTMKNGEANGVSRAWYPSGFLKAEVTLSHGRVGEQHRYKDGERREEPAAPLASGRGS